MHCEAKKAIISKLAKNGIWNQLNQLQEECGEVISAVNRLRRNKDNAYINLCEEVADLKIMLLQMDILLNSEIIEQKTSEKLNRINSRIQNGQL